MSSKPDKPGAPVGILRPALVFFLLGLAAAVINAGFVVWLSTNVGGFYLTSTGKLYLAIIAGGVVLSVAARLAGWRLASAVLAVLQYAPLIWFLSVIVSFGARV